MIEATCIILVMAGITILPRRFKPYHDWILHRTTTRFRLGTTHRLSTKNAVIFANAYCNAYRLPSLVPR